MEYGGCVCIFRGYIVTGGVWGIGGNCADDLQNGDWDWAYRYRALSLPCEVG